MARGAEAASRKLLTSIATTHQVANWFCGRAVTTRGEAARAPDGAAGRSREADSGGKRIAEHGQPAPRLLAGGLHPERMVTHRFSLSEAPTAFRLFDAGQAAKVVLQP